MNILKRFLKNQRTKPTNLLFGIIGNILLEVEVSALEHKFKMCLLHTIQKRMEHRIVNASEQFHVLAPLHSANDVDCLSQGDEFAEPRERIRTVYFVSNHRRHGLPAFFTGLALQFRKLLARGSHRSRLVKFAARNAIRAGKLIIRAKRCSPPARTVCQVGRSSTVTGGQDNSPSV